MTTWLLSRRARARTAVTVAKMRITRPEPRGGPGRAEGPIPARNWFTVLCPETIVAGAGASGTILVEAGQAAEVLHDDPRMPSGARGGPAEVLCILDHDGQRNSPPPPHRGLRAGLRPGICPGPRGRP